MGNGSEEERMQPGRMTRRRFLYGAAGVGLAATAFGPLDLLLSGCGSGQPYGAGQGGGTPQAGGTLRIAIGADANGLDPESVLNNNAGYVMSAIYDGLTSYKPGTTEIAPGLAESWDVSPDATTYTFHLRKGVRFHDGSPFDADAVVAWLDRLLNKQNPHYYGNQQGIDSFVDFTFGGVRSYTKVDASTVRVELKAPDATLLTNLAMVWSGVTSPAAVDKYGYGLQQHPVGTGPFVFVEWVPNDHITLKANPDYWGGKPHLDQIVYQVVPDASTALLKLRNGEVDVLTDVSPEQVKVIQQDPNLQLLTQPGLVVLGVALPVDHKPFDDRRVRQALNYAVDKDSLNKYLFAGLAPPMRAPMPTVEWGTSTSLAPYPQNLEKAKQLLREAGYGNGLDLTMWVYNTTRGYNPAGGTRLGTALQADFQKAGVNVTLRQLEWTAYLAKVRDRALSDMALTGWSGDNGDPDDFLSPLYGTSGIPAGNQAHYSNPAVDRILDQARTITDQSKRVELYQQVQKTIWDDAPWVWLNSVKQVRAASKKVRGLLLNPTEMYFGMHRVWLGK
jgi:peptide/nickel transport system substrate-binding protein